MENLRALLADHASALGGELGVFPIEVERIAHLDEGVAIARLEELVQRQRRRSSPDRDARLRATSSQAVARLAMTAAFGERDVRLDPDLLLGQVLAERVLYLAFRVYEAEVAIERSLLLRARRALSPFADVTAHVASDALRLGWRDGRGGLILRSQRIARDQRERVLDIVLTPLVQEPARSATPTPAAVVTQRPAAPPWLTDLFGELVLHPWP
ncbi:MAG TPA: hypothetical protein VH062_00360 [Polyangiaceae bacterium]|jgi:hypothetical protein|nr:hypothetical protein [Polyangiaceae bacterium]